MTTIRWYFEDFYEGLVIDAGSCVVDAEELDAFARRYDPQPFHIDAEAAAASIYGSVIASGWQTCSLMMRLMVDGLLHETASLGSPGLDEVRWIKPVRAGDTLHVRAITTGIRSSISKPERGIVQWLWEARNQHGEVVTTIVSMGMVGRRPVAIGESADA